MQANYVEAFARRDTAEQVRVLRTSQTLDTEVGDAVLGYLAGHHPERYAALVAALERDGL